MVTDVLRDLEAAFSANANAERARQMSAYMRDLFPFYGIPAPRQRAIARDVLTSHDPPPDEAALSEVTLACWERPQREWQYFGCDLAARYVHLASPGFLPTTAKLITTKSWWDTVDALAARVVGPLVTAHPALVTTMDRWIQDPNIWLARTAILFQLKYGPRTDADRLFNYCLRRADEREFFLRKAIGWALRQYSKTDEGAVRLFVRNNDAVLSGLSKREALKWLDQRR